MLMEQFRKDAEAKGRAAYAVAFEHLIETHPVFAKLNWDGIDGDQLPYDVMMGEAEAKHFNVDSTYPSVAEERRVSRVATVRPIYGKMDTPFIGRRFQTPTERLKAHVDAVVKRFMSSFVGGRYVTAGAVTGLSTASLAFVQAGPHWDEASRGQGRGGGVVKIRKDGTDFYVSFKAYFDTAFGTELGPYTAAVATVDLTLKSANPYYWVKLTLDKNALPSATDVGSVEFTSSTFLFDGVKALVAPELDLNVATGAGEDFNFGHLDTLDSTVEGDGEVLVLMPSRTFNSMKEEARSIGGATIEAVQGLSDTFRYAGGRMLVMREPNIPINITHGGTGNCTYLVAMGLNTGIRGVFSTDERNEADGRMMGGLSIRKTGELEDSDHDRTKIVGYWSIWNPQRQGLVCLNGIKN